MKSQVLKYIGFIVFNLSFCLSAAAQMKADIKNEIDKIIYYDTEILSKNIPGYSIGLIYKDSIFIYHYGTSDIQGENKLEDDAIFELGGLSKVFTAALVEVLVQEEVLDYNKPFNHYLDSSFHNQSLVNLTIEDLVTHQSRLPKLPFEFGTKEKEANNPYAHYTKADLLDFYKGYFLDEETKKEYFYSNINFALLEIAIERSTGKDFEAILKEKLLSPLGMENTFVHLNSTNGRTPTPGYSISGHKAAAFKFQSFAASEGIKSTMGDLIKFVLSNIGAGTSKLSGSFSNIQQPVAATNYNKYAKVAKGWHVVENKKYYNAILHSGSTNGHRAYIGFVKETQTGVVMVSNSEHGVDGLGFLILRMLNHNWKKERGKKKGRK